MVLPIEHASGFLTRLTECWLGQGLALPQFHDWEGAWITANQWNSSTSWSWRILACDLDQHVAKRAHKQPFTPPCRMRTSSREKSWLFSTGRFQGNGNGKRSGFVQ